MSTGSRRALSSAAAGLLALGGAGCSGFALTHQQHAPQPPLSLATSSPSAATPGSTPAATAGSPPASAAAVPTLPPPGSASDPAPTAASVLPPQLAPVTTAAPAPGPGPGTGTGAARGGAPGTAAPQAPGLGSVGVVLPASAPLVLTIPAIRVRSSLLQLGQEADGSLEVPAPGPQYDQAGWYRYSPTPGSLGPAVIAGHIDSAAKGPSVFYRLGALKPHDVVQVSRADGSVAEFAVDAVRRYPKTDFPSGLVYGNTDHAALRLITCGGAFDRSSGHYVDNIVVTASLVATSAG